MIVLRVECKHRFGPWRRCGALECRKVFIGIGDNHPAPIEDIYGRTIYHDEVCGVDSFRQLVFWFSGQIVRQRLHENGYHIAVYDVDEYDCSFLGTQIVFIQSRATLLANIPLGVDAPRLALVGS